MRLKDVIIDIASGPFGSNLKVDCFVPDGFPIIDGANLTEYRLTDNVTKFVTEEKARSLSRSIAQRHDVVVTISGTLGQISYIPLDSKYKEYLCSQRQFRVTFNEDIVDVEYLVYYFHTKQGQKKILSFANYVGVPALAQPIPNFKNIEIDFPHIDYQHRVAKFIGRINDKITLNIRMNAELEAMAKQLYDYWFVQFDFPDENGKPYKSSGGKMVWNEKLKREIPEGWEDATLSEIANITMGQSPDGSTYNEDGNGMIFYQGSTDFGIRFPSVRMYTTSPTRFASKGDILMSVRAPVGDTNIANTDCCIGRGLSALNSKIGSTTHLYHILGDLKAKFDQLNAAGTTFGAITKDELFSLPVVKPSSDILQNYEDICFPLFEKQMKIGHEINHFTHLRDSLLPMLMNGQVTIE